jgi:xanthine dehydrogenase YagS FAD-binding subunit
MLPNFAYVKADSVKQAIAHLSDPGARLHAGGTDLLGCLNQGIFPGGKVVSITPIKELRGVKEEAGGIRIGALTTVAAVAASPLINGAWKGLAEAAASVASPQLRNQGTVGGNLCQKPRCWYYRGDFECLRKDGAFCSAVAGDNRYHCLFGGDPCYFVHPSDLAPALVALEAEIRMVGPAGSRVVPATRFFVSPADDYQNETVVQPGEIVTEIMLRKPAEPLVSSYSKIRARGSWDFALVSLALVVSRKAGKVSSCRIVLGGVAPVPWRCSAAEEVLRGQEMSAAVIAEAAQAAVKGAEPLDHNRYKVAMVQGLVEQRLAAVAGA